MLNHDSLVFVTRGPRVLTVVWSHENFERSHENTHSLTTHDDIMSHKRIDI